MNWILISGLRGLSVGDDTKAYEEQFTNIKFQTCNSLFEAFNQKYFHHGDGKDIGYGILEKTFQIISTNYQFWLIKTIKTEKMQRIVSGIIVVML